MYFSRGSLGPVRLDLSAFRYSSLFARSALMEPVCTTGSLLVTGGFGRSRRAPGAVAVGVSASTCMSWLPLVGGLPWSGGVRDFRGGCGEGEAGVDAESSYGRLGTLSVKFFGAGVMVAAFRLPTLVACAGIEMDCNLGLVTLGLGSVSESSLKTSSAGVFSAFPGGGVRVSYGVRWV